MRHCVARESVVIPCRTATCENVQVLRYDDPLPPGWLCSACEDRIFAQQMDELTRRHAHKLRTARLNPRQTLEA